jgi:hypothetical protein
MLSARWRSSVKPQGHRCGLTTRTWPGKCLVLKVAKPFALSMELAVAGFPRSTSIIASESKITAAQIHGGHAALA